MSTIKSSAENLTLNADGANNDVIIQSNGSTKVTVDGATGTLGVTGTVTAATLQTTAGGTVTTASGNDLNIVYPAGRSLFLKEGTETHLTIDNVGNVGIGGASLTMTDGSLESGVAGTFSINGATGTAGAPAYCTYGFNGDPNTGMYSGTADTVKFATAGSERMHIDSSGYVLVGTTTSGQIILKPDNGVSYADIGHINGTASGYAYGVFRYNGAIIGRIDQNGTTGVSYNTSSDYRLKENVVYDWDATTRLKQLKPARFNFIADDTTTVDGFLAHEAQAIVPEAITGTKDAMRDEEYEVTAAVAEVRDADDNITTEAVEAVMGTRSVPDYQGIDQSKLVPLLVKTIQELEARLTAGGL